MQTWKFIILQKVTCHLLGVHSVENLAKLSPSTFDSSFEQLPTGSYCDPLNCHHFISLQKITGNNRANQNIKNQSKLIIKKLINK